MTIDPNNTPDPTTTAPAVHIDKLSFRYRSLDDDPQPKRTAAAPTAEPPEQANAIEDISFSLPAGKLMLIAGPSGCGKSTLLKCLNGLIPNSYKGTLSGEVQLHGPSIKGLSLPDLAQEARPLPQTPSNQIPPTPTHTQATFA